MSGELPGHVGATVAALEEQRRVWEERPMVRRLYLDWFAAIVSRLAPVAAPTVEVGAGCGAFKDFMPEVLATDVVPTPWADRVADAENLPFESRSLGNLVMTDVFHHLPRPARALREVQRVLKPGGRAIMVEPYCSPVSTVAYRHLHHEDLGTAVGDHRSAATSSDDPLDASISLPTEVFWKRPELLTRWTPALSVIEKRRFSLFVYPLSGGFSRRQILAARLAGPALNIERALTPLLAPLLAFRCLVVLERQSKDG